jgi:hypothetical protein
VTEQMVIFRQNSGCFTEQNTLGILFRTLPPKRKQLGIPFCGTKIEANSRNSVPNHFAEEKTTQNKMWQLKISNRYGQIILLNYFGCFVKEIFSRNSVPPCSELRNWLFLELGMPRNEHFHPPNNGNRSEFIPRNFFPFPTLFNTPLGAGSSERASGTYPGAC